MFDVLDPAQRDAGSLEAGPGEKDEELEEPEMGLQTTIALLAIVTLVCRLFISLTVWGLIGSNSSLPSPLSSSWIPSTVLLRVATSKGFVGLILLPNVGNAAGMSSHTSIVTIFRRPNLVRSRFS